VEVGLVNGEIVINPTKDMAQNSTLQLTMAGTVDGILMIEGFAQFVPDAIFMEAMKKGHEAIGEICRAIEAFRNVAGKPKKLHTLRIIPKELLTTMDEV
jgi:polyribonucleotide nucleotidyltransferase